MTPKTHAIVWAAGVIGGAALIDVIAGVLAGSLASKPPLVVIGAVGGLAASAAVAGLLTRLRAWRAAGWRVPEHPASLLWFLPLLVYALLPLAQGPRESTPVAAGIVFALSIGFWKIAALSLALALLAPSGQWRAASLAGLLFGLAHLLALLVGAAVPPTLVNALASGLLGFAVAALALRTGLAWPAAALYSMLLFAVAVTGGLDAVNMATSVAALVPAVAISGLLALVGLSALATRPRAAAPARAEG